LGLRLSGGKGAGKSVPMSLVDSGLSAPVSADRFAKSAWLRALEMTAPVAAHRERIFPAVIDELAETYEETPALLSDRQCLSFRALAGLSHGYAGWAVEQGIGRGDVVGLLMPNCPEYVAIWLGVTRTGATVSLLNTHLRGGSLAHCINIVAARHIIVAADLFEALQSARRQLAVQPQIWLHGEDREGFARIDLAIQASTGTPAKLVLPRPVRIGDVALHIYTSGTTGLPKAAHVSHQRLMQWSHWFAGMMGTSPGDRMYNCLPLYHSVGGVVAVGAALVAGGSVVIRETFSAREFWDDIARWDCTLFQYIGELCRYLVNAPPHRLERSHRLRLCCGNGLRPDIWNDFRARFGIPRILEFYAATEGSFSLYNAEGEPGAIGRIPPFLTHRFPVALVRHDIERGQPQRDADGFCIPCGPNEVGEAIGRISGGKPGASGRFEGYTDPSESEKKILRDVFDPADAWFRTGDLMRKDERGFYYFVDRVGDTFRWKGENVSTTEVAEAMTDFPGIVEATVYGVAIAGTEGRAGMAAIVTAEGFDFGGLRDHLVKRLPRYARPLFVRVRSALDVTPTFKPKKQDLSQVGYDPAQIDDPVYFNDERSGSFVPLDDALYARLQSGQLRL
jgi:fatty-acyl-CoA synthase